MNPALVISKREIRAYFNSPVAYIVVTAFAVITGLHFFTRLFIFKQADMRNFFEFVPLVYVFVIPAITMRLLAEEKGSGTLEMLITMPVRDSEVVLGKFLAALFLLCTALALTAVFAITVKSLGPLDVGVTVGGYVGLLLMGSAYAGIGMMASALTRNQIVAFIISFVICAASVLLGMYVQVLPQAIQPLAAFLSVMTHFENVSRGVVDSRDVIYYLSVTVVGLLIATTALESRKWK
jgi:ABC-2 type transport system permease protein